MHTVLVQLDGGKLPTKAHESDAGWDLYSTETVTIRAGESKLIGTGIRLAIPEGFVGLVWPKSGLAVKKGVDTMAGVIDSGYRGELKVLIHNTNQYLPLFHDDQPDIEIKEGDKMAQILFQEIPHVLVQETSSLDDSDRGDKGFGSSGR